MKSKRTKKTQDFKLHVLGSSTRPDWRNIVHSPAVKRVVAILSYISGRNIVPVAVDPSTYTILPKHESSTEKRTARSQKPQRKRERKVPRDTNQDHETQRD